jgi:hypothetical protein
MTFRKPLIALVVFAIAPTLAGAPAPRYEGVGLGRLEVTAGAVGRADGWLVTRSGEMRGVMRDAGRHAAAGRLRFRLTGPSDDVTPLGSGLVRQQIGLKLRAADPCNLVYVMWRTAPDSRIAIFVKRNPGQSTSAECGNRGYTDVATVPAATAADGDVQVLEARTARRADGSLALTVLTDGVVWDREVLPAALVAGLEGPLGVRSDNGAYEFHIGAGNRSRMGA